MRGGAAAALRPAALARGHGGGARGALHRDAGAAEVPAHRPGRGAGDRRGGAPAGHGGAGRRPSRLTDRTDPDGAARAPAARGRSRATSSTASAARLRALLGPDFVANALPIDAERDGLHLGGFAALPTFSRGAAVAQHLFVNGRPVRDKLLLGALRAAYADLLARDRHPAAALFLDLPTRRGGRERASGQGRGALPRPGPGARAGGRRAAAGAGRRRAPRRRRTTGGAMLGAFRAAAAAAAAGGGAGALGAGAAAAPGFAEPAADGWAAARVEAPAAGGGRGGRCRSGWRGRRCTRPTSSRRPPTGS